MKKKIHILNSTRAYILIPTKRIRGKTIRVMYFFFHLQKCVQRVKSQFPFIYYNIHYRTSRRRRRHMYIFIVDI